MPETSQFRALIHRVRHRDEDAARELVSRYESAIRRVVRIHLRDRRIRRLVDSHDVCQSVLATFFVRTALGEYELETPEQLIRLLTSITRNKLVNEVHRQQAQRRDLRKTTGLEGDGANLVDDSPGPAEQICAKDSLDHIRTKLTAEEQYLADQRSFGRTWVELAAELGGTDVALRKKLSRALNRAMSELGLDDYVEV